MELQQWVVIVAAVVLSGVALGLVIVGLVKLIFDAVYHVKEHRRWEETQLERLEKTAQAREQGGSDGQ